jgi:hypothetical protein
MSDYERFRFDLKGFIVIPSVLTAAETDAVRSHVEAYSRNPESLPPHLRAPMAGPGEFLLDHPRVMGVLAALLDPNPRSVRMESVFCSLRSTCSTKEEWGPHAGANILPSFNYKNESGRIYAGMTRCVRAIADRGSSQPLNSGIPLTDHAPGRLCRSIVWELNEVVHGKGGTCLMPGSHKASERFHPDGDKIDSGLWETYGCPPGSLVVFTEAVRHTGSNWTHTGE